jgi:formiminotetrahydrofolate cyclodeaminase
MTIAALTVSDFLDSLASSEPTPGGGALAALTGASAAAMLAMVGNLTRGRPRFADVEARVTEIVSQADVHRARLLELADADADAYAAVRDAYRLPRASDDEKQARAAAIEAALHVATDVPADTAAEARAVLDLATAIAETGNPTVLPDVAVGAHVAAAAVRAAATQAEYNLANITDAAYAEAMQSRIDHILTGIDRVIAHTLDTVQRRVSA